MEYSATAASAEGFAAAGALESWVHRYLCAEGGNVPFSEGLKKCERFYFGPLPVKLNLLCRCCGPEEGMRFPVEREGFERKVEHLSRVISSGEDLPPLIVGYDEGVLTVNDGNHRLEALNRLGRSESRRSCGRPGRKTGRRWKTSARNGEAEGNAQNPLRQGGGVCAFWAQKAKFAPKMLKCLTIPSVACYTKLID